MHNIVPVLTDLGLITKLFSIMVKIQFLYDGEALDFSEKEKSKANPLSI